MNCVGMDWEGVRPLRMNAQPAIRGGGEFIRTNLVAGRDNPRAQSNWRPTHSDHTHTHTQSVRTPDKEKTFVI